MRNLNVSNPLLKTRAPEGWQGTPLDEKGRFRNLQHPFWPEFNKLLRWQSQPNPQKAAKRKDLWLPDIIKDASFKEKQDDCLVWLGHSSFFLRLSGVGVLIDPVLGNATVVKRKIPFPYDAAVAKEARYLLISHDHRDHLDLPSIKSLGSKNPGLEVMTGLGMQPLLRPVFPKNQIQEAGWFQQYSTNGPLSFWFLPSRHWSRRGLNDTNRRLWGGFVISDGSQHIYFMGDSGWDTHFEDIGKLFPGIRYAIMGIGAYSPEWFMHPSHMKPEDSWTAFLQLNAEHFIPMHYGTFDLADEPLSEPLVRLRACSDPGRLLIPIVGQTIWL